LISNVCVVLFEMWTLQKEQIDLMKDSYNISNEEIFIRSKKYKNAVSFYLGLMLEFEPQKSICFNLKGVRFNPINSSRKPMALRCIYDQKFIFEIYFHPKVSILSQVNMFVSYFFTISFIFIRFSLPEISFPKVKIQHTFTIQLQRLFLKVFLSKFFLQ
jgi:hypothetical protein